VSLPPVPGSSLDTAPARPTAARAWLLAIRPATLPAAVGPVLVGLGVAVGEGVFVPGPALGALAVALLLQIASNLANDLFDFRSGADTAERLGPPRVAALGLIGERELAAGIGIVLGLAGLVGLYLVLVGGWPILVLGIAAIVSAVAYTGGPWPYGYRGLGEVFVFAFFGLVAVTGTAYLQTGQLEPLAVAASLPVGALVTAILVVNNLRDLDSDRRAGKRTLAVRLGERGAVGEYVILVAGAYLVLVVLFVAWMAPLRALLPLLSLPLALPLLRTVLAGGDPRRLNAVLRGTARLSLVFGALLALGLSLAAWT
jgi:1,4-dihydroxy-2-naphthoate octaprenyltransferase